MSNIKKFKAFLEENSPSRESDVKPTTTPTRRDNPTKPGPIRRTKPGVEPDPKAIKKEPKKATEKDVINKFAELTNQKKK